MTLSAIHNNYEYYSNNNRVVCDIGGYDFVSYSQPVSPETITFAVVCDIGGYDFVSFGG